MYADNQCLECASVHITTYEVFLVGSYASLIENKIFLESLRFALQEMAVVISGIKNAWLNFLGLELECLTVLSQTLCIGLEFCL